MMRWLAIIALAGCGTPVWSIRVKVTAPAGQPLADAVLVVTGCPRQNEHDLGTHAAMTDHRGEADIGAGGSQYPDCTITIARPGYTTRQFTLNELCRGDRENCDRSQHVDVVLAPLR